VTVERFLNKSLKRQILQYNRTERQSEPNGIFSYYRNSALRGTLKRHMTAVLISVIIYYSGKYRSSEARAIS
jgi:hypothetical protein